MAKVFVEDTEMQDIADSVRLVNGDVMGETKYKPSEMASAILTGVDKKYFEGDSQGYQRGKAEGEQIGYQNGYTQGSNEGYEQGHTNGYNDGYSEGYNVGCTEVNKTVDDLLSGNTNTIKNIVNNRIDWLRSYCFTSMQIKSAQFDNVYVVGGYTFQSCTALVTVILPNVVTITNAGSFSQCVSLENVVLSKGYVQTTSSGIGFANSQYLTDESIQNIIDALATVSTSKKLTLHSTVKSKLTDEQLAQISAKNWTLG